MSTTKYNQSTAPRKVHRETALPATELATQGTGLHGSPRSSFIIPSTVQHHGIPLRRNSRGVRSTSMAIAQAAAALTASAVAHL
mmetsp:Transcript_46551/g.72854  ORF Transcript_46551/g.72854 Transcript_46551/m.72854 type:complete len:84 (+) Transcript_46551:397-648(+)